MGKNVPREDESSFDDDQAGANDEFGSEAGEAVDEVDETVEQGIEDGKAHLIEDAAFADQDGPIESER